MIDPESNDKTIVTGGIARNSISTEFQPGDYVSKNYQVQSRLGRGGMGLVYRVNQILLNKEFALKTLDKGSMSELAISRFQQEARTSFSLNHPSIIAVNEFGVLDDQTPYLVMELINGETLGERIKRSGCMTVEQAIPIFIQVCFGLAYAHECGIVHRDIKPSNIMLLKGLPLGTEGSVKIVDFGIAKFTGHEGGEIQSLTRTGEIFGSPLYMSPEQCSGFKVDHRADIYSLGCVLFEALTGNPPFMGENALTTMMKHQSEKAPTLREATLGGEFPQAIEDIVATMLAKSPENRYQNLSQVAQDLIARRRGEASARTAVSATATLPRENRISMPAVGFFLTLLAVLLLGVSLGALGTHIKYENERAVAIQETRLHDDPNLPVFTQEQIDEESKAMSSTKPITDARLQEKLEAHRADGSLILKNVKLTEDSFKLIAHASWLRSLELRDCDVDSKGIAMLAKASLTTISLNDGTLNDEGAKSLSKCEGLRQISANNNRTLTDTGVVTLAKIPGLKKLVLANTGVTDDCLIAVGKSKSLEFLELKGVKAITDAGMKRLSGTNLTYLDVGATAIDDQSMPYLAQMAKLNAVVLSRTTVTAGGVERLLNGNNTCKHVVLLDSGLTRAQFQELRQKFPHVGIMDQIATTPGD